MQTRPQVTISAQTWEGYWVTLLARPWLTMTAGKRPAARGLNGIACGAYAMPAPVARDAQVRPAADARITHSRAARADFTIQLYSQGTPRMESDNPFETDTSSRYRYDGR